MRLYWPSYNTGEEGWVYGDNVNSPMIQEWFKSEVPVDKEDNKYNNYFLFTVSVKSWHL